MHGFTLAEMMMHGWPVLSVLAVGSLLTWAIVFERLIVLWRARTDARAFVERIVSVLRSGGRASALAGCGPPPTPVAVVCARILQERGEREDRERAQKHALQDQIRRLQRFLPVLGTIAGTAPFVGLLGTVIGIVKAFRDIAVNVGAGPEVVSAGIAEALVTTAAGLIVAIPALIGYNYFVNRVRNLAEEIDLAAFYLVEELERPGEEES